jgi:hypothetical protein
MMMMMKFPDSGGTEETIAAQLERIEAKLDAILEKLKWAPGDMAGWYVKTTQGGVPEAKQESPSDGQGGQRAPSSKRAYGQPRKLVSG